MQTNDYLEYLDEDFDFVNKVFKANVVKRIFKKIKSNIKGKNINMDGVKTALKPIPVLTQEKINIFMDKYVPNYKQNYAIAKKHFDRKFPTKDTDALAGMTAAITPLDKKKTLQDQIKRTDRILSSNLGTSSAGGGLVIFFTGITVAMVSWNLPELFDSLTKQVLAVAVGILLMLAGIRAAIG